MPLLERRSVERPYRIDMSKVSPLFTPAVVPAFEAERLQDLYALKILDTAAEERFDRYTRLVANIFDVPIALVSLVDKDRQWFKSACGLEAKETSRDVAFCAHAILEPEMLVIPDARNDPRFAGNPLVVNEPYVRFYAGAVLRGPVGKPIGTLCLIDHKPRDLSERERDWLRELARLVERELQHDYQVEQLRQQIERTAYYDPLTELPNRRLVRDRLHQAILAGKKNARCLAAMFLDIDRFGALNSALGRAAGDAVLKEVARRLRAAVNPSWTVGRWQDDQFVILAHGPSARIDPATIVKPLLKVFHVPFHIGDVAYPLTVRLGASTYPEDGHDPDSLLEKAAAALRVLPVGNMSAYRFYTRDMDQDTVRRFDLEGRLRQAVERHQLHLVYQPKVALRTGQICGMEALLRWTEPELGPVSPAEFIPIAEQSGLILALGDWVIRTACRQNRRWQQSGMRPLPVAVNLTSARLRQPNFKAWIREVLAETGLEARYLNLEVTEGTLIDDIEEAIENMREANELGVIFSIDDFGTGYSSLSYLKRLPLRTFKVDKSFVDEMTSNVNDATIAHAIIAMAHSLNLNVVAEGVEKPEQLTYLRAYQCDEIQGYLFSRPLMPDELAQWVAEDRRLA